MAIYNLGSINLDHLYRVDHFVRPGETLASSEYQTLLGGKGANQSIALARAGAEVYHIGAIGKQDAWVLADMQAAGIDTTHVRELDIASGHAIIQLNRQAENAIILYAGANHSLSREQITSALEGGGQGDWLLLQHETNGLQDAIDLARQQGMSVAYNPAPMVLKEARPLIADVDLLIVNEIEAMDLTGTASVNKAEAALGRDYPGLRILLTLGRDGVVFIGPQERRHQPAFVVEAIDTTAAGDTFIGYSLAGLASDATPAEAMLKGTAASALCVTRLGASVSIPSATEVDAFLQP